MPKSVRPLITSKWIPRGNGLTLEPHFACRDALQTSRLFKPTSRCLRSA
jgi:hypothetical protein